MRVLVIVGPTAVGKSTLAVAVAQQLQASGPSAEIISADSMQAYIGMDIGTATPNASERGGIPHHLLDVWPVAHPLTVVDFQQAARTAIDQVSSRGAVPIVVGGSGLYISAILDDLQFPATDADVRAKYEEQLQLLGPEALHSQLAAVDPEAASAILPTNGRRIVRALEVIEEKKRVDAARLIRDHGDGVEVLNGRFGPYITDGEKNAKIPKDREPTSLTREECVALLAAAPAAKGRGRFGRKKVAAKKTAKPAKAKAPAKKKAAKKKTTKGA